MEPDSADYRYSGDSAHSRRRFLALAAAGAAGVAGCSTGTTNPTASPAGGDGSDGDGPTGTGGADGAAVGRSIEQWSGYDPDWEAPTSSPLEASLDTEVLVENLEIPWDLSFAPDGTLFLTERVGNVLVFDGDDVRTVAEPADAIDAGSVEPGADESSWYVDGGEGGTLGIAVHPTYPDPSLVYVYYTYETEDDKTRNRVDAFDVQSDDPGTPHHTVVEGIPGDSYHNGGRITFGPRNYLWITCGDGLDASRAPDTGSLGGKILRVTPEGDAPPDNPDLGEDADPRVFTYGHRNPQGIVWLPDGTPVISEHGPSYGGDEFNRLEAGANYGWGPEDVRVRRRDDYPGSDVHKPVFNSGGTSFAPTGSLFYTGENVPALRNRMITGGLISQQLVVTTLTLPGDETPPAEDAHAQVTADWSDDAYVATVHTMFEDELGRIRHVEQSPDGDVYVITSNRDGRAKGDFPTERDDVLVRITQE